MDASEATMGTLNTAASGIILDALMKLLLDLSGTDAVTLTKVCVASSLFDGADLVVSTDEPLADESSTDAEAERQLNATIAAELARGPSRSDFI